MNVSLDQFAIEVARITDAGELVDYVVRVFREGFGVSLFNFGIYGKLDHFARFTDHPTGVASVMPVEWAERYLAEDHFSRDRAFAHLQFGNGSRCWTSFREEEGGDVVMQEVTAFGLSHGLAIPLFGSGYVKAGIMIGGDKLIEAADVRPILEAMAVIFHARFDQIGRQVERPALSALQLEILKWMGQGKSKSVIAE
ncbi:MAG: autoinducer binding domain-containing protein, partial [Parvibaculum sp.]